MNPLDLAGPDFLLLFTALMGGSLVWMVGARISLNITPQTMPADEAKQLAAWSPYQIAVLTSGVRRAAEAAAAALVGDGSIVVTGDTAELVGSPTGLEPIEQTLAAAVPGGSITAAVSAAEAPARDLEDRLITEGFLHPEATLWAHRALIFAGPGLVAALGLTKVLIGLSRGKPVSLLLLMLGLLTAAAVVGAYRVPRQTQRGRAAAAWFSLEYDALRRGVASHGGVLRGADMALAVALVGLYGAQVASLSPLTVALNPLPVTTGGGGSSCGSSSGCGSGCSGGCGGGCGGCGG